MKYLMLKLYWNLLLSYSILAVEHYNSICKDSHNSSFSLSILWWQVKTISMAGLSLPIRLVGTQSSSTHWCWTRILSRTTDLKEEDVLKWYIINCQITCLYSAHYSVFPSCYLTDIYKSHGAFSYHCFRTSEFFATSENFLKLKSSILSVLRALVYRSLEVNFSWQEFLYIFSLYCKLFVSFPHGIPNFFI